MRIIMRMKDIVDKASLFDAHVVTVSDLLCSTLAIPEYQRPYRWEEKNVRQLLDDICTSWDEEKSLYRIGSVILHRYRKDSGWVNDIVDGQQRITTILLILKALEHNTKTQLTYNHTDSYKNICLNYAYIQDWLRENVSGSEADFLKYLLDSCQFVQITVSDRSEAFQMFDSQNGRGKELEAYNLLKSYHIRAMDQNTHEEKIACDVRWEQAVDLAARDYFDINAILSYMVRVNIVARWALLDPKRGRQMLDRIMAELDGKELINNCN